jgi:ABC-2 type transport system permease protein
MFYRIFHITIKELIQTLRDKRSVGLLLVAPVVQLVVFGYVATIDLKKSPVVICDYSQTRMSREFIQKFTSSGYFEVRYYATSIRDIDDFIDKGKAIIAISIPVYFAEKLIKGEQTTVSFIIDGSNSNRATIVASYVNFITANYSKQVLTDYLSRNGFKTAQLVDAEPRVWFNPELKSVNFMVPGVMGQLTLILLLNITSLCIVREREVGTAEQIVVTPIKPLELIIGKTVPAIFAGFLVTTLVLVVGLAWYNIDFAGSVLLLYFFAGIFMFCAIAVGLLISSYAQTGDQAMWANQFFMMPNMMLSGFIFPVANMPHLIQYLTYALPMRYFLVIIRGIFLRGAGFAELWPQAAALLGWGIIIAALAALRLRKHLI